MSTTGPRTIQQITDERETAEQAAAEAEHACNILRVEHATAVLREAFPQHALAVFGRYWDEDEPRLMQLVSVEDGVDDINIDADTEPKLFSRGQTVACNTAERAILAIGDDDKVLEYLQPGDEDHEDWYEFDLPLDGAPEITEPCPTDPGASRDADGFCTAHGNDCADYAMFRREG